MRLQYTALVGIEEMENAFPKTLQPSVGLTDFTVNLTPNTTTEFEGWKNEPLLNCIFPQPVFVPFNQIYTAGVTTVTDNATHINTALPTFPYTALNISGAYAVQAFTLKPFGTQYFDVLCTNEANADQMVLEAVGGNPNTQGFSCSINKNSWTTIKATGAANTTYWDCQWTVDNSMYYRVSGSSSSYAIIESSPDASNWKTIQGKIKVGDSPLSTVGNAYPGGTDGIYIEVICLNGLMMVSVGGQSAPFVIALPGGNAYPLVTNITLHAENFTQFSWQIHPLLFQANCTYTSQQKTLGFVPAGGPYYQVTSLNGAQTLNDGDSFSENDAWTAQVTTINGFTPNPQYRIDASATPRGVYDGTPYVDRAIGIVRVTLLTHGIFQARPYFPRAIVPQEIRENISFDVNSLSIHHTMDVTMSNFYGIDQLNYQYGLRGSGNQAVQMRMGWAHMPGGPDGGLGWQHFFGFATRYRYATGAGGKSHLTMSCVDQMQQLQDSLIASPPDLDGNNHYSAMAALAEKAGISPLQMAFAGLVPTIGGGTLASNPTGAIDPYSYVPGDPSPGGFFLPQGQGLHPWTPRDRTLPILSLMQQIRTVTGYLLYFDAYGYLRYEPWIPPSQTPPKKRFRATADDGYGYAGGAFNEMFNLEACASTDETRNQVIVVGIDSYSPDWSPLVYKLEDFASITQADPSDVPPQNFIGYPKPFIWLDSRFANADFAANAAAQMFQFMRLPEYTVSFQTWLQPDIFPMDVIYVDDWRSNATGIPFYVMSVQNILSVLGDNLTLTTSITGKFLI